MANSIIGNDLLAAAVSRNLNSPNNYNFIVSYHQQQFAYLRINQIIREKLNTKPVGVATADLKVRTMVMDASILNAEISARATSGSNLVLTLTENVGDKFRLNFTVADANGKLGIVQSTTLNTITIAPLNGETFAAGDFKALTYVLEGTQLVKDSGSGAQAGRYVEPRIITDYIETFRANRYFNRTDFSKTFVDQAMSGVQGMGQDMLNTRIGQALVALQVQDLAYDLLNQMEMSFIFGRSGVQNVDNGQARTQMGYLEAVEKRGGVQVNATSPITWSRFLQIAGDVFDNYNNQASEIIVLAGSNFINNVVLSASAQGYKTTAGTNSVLEGSGLNFQSVVLPLGTLTFVQNPLFNDKNRFASIGQYSQYRNMTESALFMSVAPMKDQFGNQIPVIQKYYGEYGGNGDGIFPNMTSGIIDKNGKFVQEAMNQQDGVTLGLTAHCGEIIANAQPLGYFMLSA